MLQVCVTVWNCIVKYRKNVATEAAKKISQNVWSHPDLGSKPFRVLMDITLPLLAPGMVSGWLLAFTLSLDDLVIASFVSGPGSTTLPMLIFSKVKLGVTPDVNALAALVISIVAAGVLLAAILMQRNERRARRDTQLSASADPG